MQTGAGAATGQSQAQRVALGLGCQALAERSRVQGSRDPGLQGALTLRGGLTPAVRVLFVDGETQHVCGVLA
jgi:hypothetical protein